MKGAPAGAASPHRPPSSRLALALTSRNASRFRRPRHYVDLAIDVRKRLAIMRYLLPPKSGGSASHAKPGATPHAGGERGCKPIRCATSLVFAAGPPFALICSLVSCEVPTRGPNLAAAPGRKLDRVRHGVFSRGRRASDDRKQIAPAPPCLASRPPRADRITQHEFTAVQAGLGLVHFRNARGAPESLGMFVIALGGRWRGRRPSMMGRRDRQVCLARGFRIRTQT